MLQKRGYWLFWWTVEIGGDGLAAVVVVVVMLVEKRRRTPATLPSFSHRAKSSTLRWSATSIDKIMIPKRQRAQTGIVRMQTTRWKYITVTYSHYHTYSYIPLPSAIIVYVVHSSARASLTPSFRCQCHNIPRLCSCTTHIPCQPPQRTWFLSMLVLGCRDQLFSKNPWFRI